ncbi:MAG: GNAT family N-acetyltransferase [Eubacteriales bacterium]|jgi:diamine N-acetyltransferase
MVHLEKINRKNVWDILRLKVAEPQKGFVSPNDVSIIEAYASNAADGHFFPLGIYDDDIPVGFVMIGFDVDDYWDYAPQIARGNYGIIRLMIDEARQGKGYGRTGLKLALEYIKSFPCGAAEFCWLSYKPQNEAARNLYLSLGFAETGEMYGDESIAVYGL